MQISVRMSDMTIKPFTDVHLACKKHHPFCVHKIADTFGGRFVGYYVARGEL